MLLVWPEPPGFCTNFTVQSKADLTSTSSWSSVSAAVFSSNGNRYVSLPLGLSNQFYRLFGATNPAPSLITGLEPSLVSTNGGTTVYVVGQNLCGVLWVRVAGQLIQPTFASPDQLQFIMPALPAGSYDVELVGLAGQTVATASLAMETAADFVLGVREPPERPLAEPCACASCSQGPVNPAPLYLFSGEFYETEVDLRIPGVGLDFIWGRKYRSRLGPDTELGKGWDYSYNIRVAWSGTNILLWDGNGRQDLYMQRPDGTFAVNGYFREGAFEAGNTNLAFVLQFADTAVWKFHPFDGTPRQGRIETIQDRLTNTLSFACDGAGRLTNVVDTLDRNIRMAYNSDGFIESVTDFAGRQVRYEYYHNGDGGGADGDLKSATSPVVTNTPNGNDFPSGKTRTYTYSTGFNDERLNHNLLTITDARGQTFLQNTYATTTNASDPDFDRVASQQWGTSGQTLEYSYFTKTPTSGNYVVRKTIVNDRVGNVKEYYYDGRNRCLIERAFTGRAVPGQQTTETQNRPTGKLNPTDPDFFETRYAWNLDSLLSQTMPPNANVISNTYEADLNPATARRARGNLRIKTQIPGPLGGDQSQLTEYFEYDTQFGGCCGFNHVTRHTDGRGNVTINSYDTKGSRTNTQYRIPAITEDWSYNSRGQLTNHVLPANGSGYRRRDAFLVYAGGPQKGYLQYQITDADTLRLTNTFQYDAVGNATNRVDTRGNNTAYTVNSLNQIVQELTPVITNGTTIRYQKLVWYDANNNVARVDLENRDEGGALQSNTHFTMLHEYDVLNRETRQTQERGSANLDNTVLRYADIPPAQQGEFVVTAYEYDANRNRTLVRQPEAAAGRQTNEVTQTLYDERDLVWRTTRAPGGPLASTFQRDYDGNGNLKATHAGLEEEPRLTSYTYDGYNRRLTTTDPMGNVTTLNYDANGNVTTQRLYGELEDAPGSANNVRLAETAYTYDAMDRRTLTAVSHFDPVSQSPIGDGLATNLTIYACDSQVIRVQDDNGHATTNFYDTASRRIQVLDAKGNSVQYTYDANNNVIITAEMDRSDLGNPDRTYSTTNTYDNLNRLIRAVDHIGRTNRYAYDSRGNTVFAADARGNVVQQGYDGLKRLVLTTRPLTSTGDGGGTPTSTLTTRQTWDDSSRLTSQTDDRTNTTRYAYDALDRRIVTQMADGTLDQVGAGAQWTLGDLSPNLLAFNNGYDAHDNSRLATDANGTVVTNTFDLLDRLTARAITPGSGVAVAPLGTTWETYGYDGQSRLVRVDDDDTSVIRRFDSMSNRVREEQRLTNAPSQTVLAVFDGVRNMLTNTYPGGRIVTRTYDALRRPLQIRAGGSVVADYFYVGTTRVERRAYGNGTRADYQYDGVLPNPTGDFGVRKVVAITNRQTVGSVILDAHTYTWDRAENKTQRRDVRAGSLQLTNSYQYDSANRLVRSARGSQVQYPATNSYILDGAGNRISASGGPHPGAYWMDYTTPEPADQQVNQYTSTPLGLQSHDANGNLTSESGPRTRTLVYDYRNQLVACTNSATGAWSHYAYDVLGRRVASTVWDGLNTTTTRYLYDGWEEIEEQGLSGTTVATYVFGPYLDEVLQMRRGGSDYYYHADDLSSITAVTDSSGNAVERYDYDDYGEPSFFNASGGPLGGSAIGNSLLFAGRRYDPETSLYYYRSRHLDPATGRFISRDTIGIWGDPANLGNGLTYVGNNPATELDPLGLGGKAGLSASLDFCVEFCTGDWTLSGKVWAGVGYEKSVWGHKFFVGWEMTRSGKIASGNWSSLKLFKCGECKSGCSSGWLSLNLGVSVSFGVVTCSVSVGVSGCTASVTLGCEANLLSLIPGAVTITTALKAVGAEAEVGIGGSISLGFCPGKSGGVVAYSAQGCLTGFVRIGYGL